KSCIRRKRFQLIQNIPGDRRCRSIVKREVNFLFVRRETPDLIRINSFQQPGSLNKVHTHGGWRVCCLLAILMQKMFVVEKKLQNHAAFCQRNFSTSTFEANE